MGNGLGHGDLKDSLNLGRKRPHAVATHHEPQELGLAPHEFALRAFGEQLVLPQRGQHRLQVLQVNQRVITLGKDGNVIAVHHTVPRLNVLRKDELHKTLKSARHAGQSERSTDELIQARRRGKRRLTHRILAHAKLMKTAE